MRVMTSGGHDLGRLARVVFSPLVWAAVSSVMRANRSNLHLPDHVGDLACDSATRGQAETRMQWQGVMDGGDIVFVSGFEERWLICLFHQINTITATVLVGSKSS